MTGRPLGVLSQTDRTCVTQKSVGSQLFSWLETCITAPPRDDQGGYWWLQWSSNRPTACKQQSHCVLLADMGSSCMILQELTSRNLQHKVDLDPKITAAGEAKVGAA